MRHPTIYTRVPGLVKSFLLSAVSPRMLPSGDAAAEAATRRVGFAEDRPGAALTGHLSVSDTTAG
jgi:hypothetical protein